MISILVSCNSRELKTHIVVLSCAGGHHLVARWVCELPQLPEGQLDLPVLVTGSYEAQSSNGFACFSGGQPAMIIAAVGAPLTGGSGSLRFLKKVSDDGIVYNPVVRKVSSYCGSNPQYKDGLLAAMEIAANKNEIWLAQGQSDYSELWVISGSKMPEIEPEHQSHRINTVALMAFHARRADERLEEVSEQDVVDILNRESWHRQPWAVGILERLELALSPETAQGFYSSEREESEGRVYLRQYDEGLD